MRLEFPPHDQTFARENGPPGAPRMTGTSIPVKMQLTGLSCLIRYLGRLFLLLIATNRVFARRRIVPTLE
jgi:hypothetical protein